MTELAIDFGTSNSAAGWISPQGPQIIPLEGDSQTLPTALFFDFEDKTMHIGRAAEQALFDGAWGRYMRSLKSLLGTALIRESLNMFGKRTTYLDIVARFLAETKARAEAETGVQFNAALSGRPVHFHNDPKRDTQALIDLTEAYSRAGFGEVRFMNEPEAAARARVHVLQPGNLGLVIDIGGGTSDFTVFRSAEERQIDIIGSGGLRLGGTDFDRMISVDHVMPMAGRGSQIRHAFGNETHTAPNAIFNDLATWAKIPFLYASDYRRTAKDLHSFAVEPEKLARLVRVLEDERGHDLAFAIEAAKIALNTDDRQVTDMQLDALARKLVAPLSQAALTQSLQDAARQIGLCAEKTVQDTGNDPLAITHLVFVGGSSLMTAVQRSVSERFPEARPQLSGALTGIIEGLARSTRG